jgi:P-type Ca2+ transporter type 2C
MNYYQTAVDKIAQTFGTNLKTGLTSEQARTALLKYGSNKRSQELKESLVTIFINQFKDPLVSLLIISGVILFFVGDTFDVYIILGILLLNATIGAIQENRIAVMVNRLHRFKKNDSLVIRDGKKEMVADENLVPGDLLILQEGESIPADARIIEAYDLTIDEAVLTGESDPVIKGTEVLYDSNLSLHHQDNMVFSGSYVLSGTAKAIIVTTGEKTESGRVDFESATFATQMPLEKDLGNLLKFILWLIVFICLSLLAIGLYTGKPFPELLAALVALFICVVPQGLPVIMTLVLVSGAYRMAKKNVLAKRLQAVEALGRAQVMIIDKTGTLTRNELMVSKVVAGTSVCTVTGSGYNQEGKIVQDGKSPIISDELMLMMDAAQLLDRSNISYLSALKLFSIKGNPSEAAMRICAEKAGFFEKQVEQEYAELFEIPFSAEYQYHAGFFEKNGKGIVFGIGSPEVMARRCVGIKDEQQQEIDSLLNEGLRVLVVGCKQFDLSDIPQDKQDFKRFFTGVFDHGLTQLGGFGIQDTLREHASEIITTLKNAGIQIVMATGDNKETATHLARQAGILDSGEQVLEGPQMQRLTDEQMHSYLDNTAVYARVLPADKLRLVTLFQKQGKTTVMIGDGVNDAPSLVVAELGVAMGNTGSEVAKEAADIILLDDSFESIVTGLRQGRHIFYTFKRVILYFFTTNFAEVLVMLVALGSGYPLPLVASQILWLNLVTDGFLDTALSLEEPEHGLLRSTWLKDYPSLISYGLVGRVFYMSILTAAFTFGVFIVYYKAGIVLARTMALATLTCCQWVSAVNCRSLKDSFLSRGIRTNPLLVLALIGVAIGQVAILYIPFLQKIFKTVPLDWQQWQIILLLGGILLIIEEVRKKVCHMYYSAN